jgi:hypothetical protein
MSIWNFSKVAILQLQTVLQTNAKNIPFNVLKYITGEVIYGGTNIFKKLLFSILIFYES